MATLLMAVRTLLTTAGAGPLDPTAAEPVDLVEVNHLYDDCGNHMLDQVIFYEWCAADGRFLVRDWRLLKKKPVQWPVRDWKAGNFRAVWYDGGLLREVRADDFRETWTQHDPEVKNREYLPRSSRRILIRGGAARGIRR